MKRIYFDNASTTSLRKEILNEILPFFDEEGFGNPSSLHFFGQTALKAIDNSREKIKGILKAEFLKEIIFTASATESNNLAIKGMVFYYCFVRKIKPHILTSVIEHPSILEVLNDLINLDLIEVTYLKPEKTSLISPVKIKENLQENTILVSLHYINSELGTIQKIQEIGNLIQEINQQRVNKIYFHTDAAQAGLENLNVQELKVDLMTLSSHKIYGPKGIALLYVKEGTPLIRLISGSEQEYNLRAGTEAVPLIIGFAKAIELIEKEREKIDSHLKSLREYFLLKIKEFDDKIILNTEIEISTPKILNLYFPIRTSQELLIYLDQKGIAVSAGTACQSRANEPNYVIREIYNQERAKKSLRFSFSIFNKKEEIDYLFDCLRQFL